MKIASSAFAVAPEGPLIFGIPLDFVLFGLTLLGVALFHQHTLRVALAGSVTIAIYKIVFTGFKTGPGVMGFVSHVGHEWVILANLVCLLMGFALLSRHFEKSHVPVALSKYLPRDWKGGFVLLVMVIRCPPSRRRRCIIAHLKHGVSHSSWQLTQLRSVRRSIGGETELPSLLGRVCKYRLIDNAPT